MFPTPTPPPIVASQAASPQWAEAEEAKLADLAIEGDDEKEAPLVDRSCWRRKHRAVTCCTIGGGGGRGDGEQVSPPASLLGRRARPRPLAL